ncbi:hypothetical protein E4U21_004843 [Claviceps maximensis]|nr:hypothetical protein E4U21_004843 [Claviceps maximensis]
MPPPSRAAGGFASMIMSDSEPDFDDIATLNVPQSRGNDQRTSTRRNQRPNDVANRVTKSMKCLARSHSGARRVNQPATTREILTEKSTNGSSTRVPNSNYKPSAQSADHSGNSLVSKDGWSQDNFKDSRGAKDKSEHKDDSIHSTDEPAAHDHESRPRPNRRRPDAAESSRPQGIACSKVEEASNTMFTHYTGDMSLENQSDEMRERYHALEARHIQLREVGVKAAECNFERLKRQSMEAATASTTLIRELKAELAVQSDVVKQNEQLGRQLEHSQTNVVELERTITDLTASLSKAKFEIQSLSAKLGAIRTMEAANKTSTVMTKTGTGGAKSTSSGALLAAQAKEDLYSDLTGLIVRGVSQIDSENVFDCIQTGRNGTLHFKLALEAGEDPEKYDEIQFTYRPQLNRERDRDLVTLLPDYLVEEITFTRTQASNFYSKLNKSLTERLE